MGSLARSLLALAVVALLQCACAQSRDEPLGPIRSESKLRCITRMFGKRAYMSYSLQPITLTRGVNYVKIHDPHRDPVNLGTDLVGEHITLCTTAHHPRVSLTVPGSFDYLKVEVDANPLFPAYIKMYVMRYIEVPGPKPGREGGDG